MTPLVVPASAVTPDPITSPGDVPGSHVIEIPGFLPKSDQRVSRVLIGALDESGGHTITPEVQLYALEAQPNPQRFVESEEVPLADRRFFKLSLPLTVVAGELRVAYQDNAPGTSPILMPPAGRCYVRIVSGPGALGSTVRIFLV